VSEMNVRRPPVSTAARMLLEPSREVLLEALDAKTTDRRWGRSYAAAMEVASVVTSVRANEERATWSRLSKVAPELADWADRFARVPERWWRMTGPVSQADADDLLRDAEAFHHLVESSLGLPYQRVLPGVLPSCEVTA
jgi:hypothetical protein